MRALWVRLPVILVLVSLLLTPAGALGQSPSLPYYDLGSSMTDGPESPGARTSHRLIVQLQGPSLADLAAMGDAGLLSDGRLDVGSAAAQSFISALQAEQAAFMSALQADIAGVSLASYRNEFGADVELTYQILFNGLTIDPGRQDSSALRGRLARMPGVKAVYLDFAHEPTMYASLPLINTAAVWEHAAIGGQANAGAGIKVASMDGGIHKDAPMFHGTGYSYPPGYPKGYTVNTNGKIIASRAYFRTWDPPAPGDDKPWPGLRGTSHGVHTAGTAAGNRVTADYLGHEEEISGVAPTAWVMSYRMFYHSVSADGAFYTAEGLAALEDIVADGADVLNNSWGAGPTSAGGIFDPLDLALINATRAGVFVSFSAGNAGPGLGTSDHPSREYIVVAATTTTGTLAAGRLNVSAPGPVVDPVLLNIPFGTAEFGAALPLAEVLEHPFVSASSVNPANVEGCSPWDGTPFQGKAVLISRGTCNFSAKVWLAEQAGAEFVIIYNNAAGGDALTNMAAGAYAELVTIPSIFIGHTAGNAMVAWHGLHGDDAEFQLDTMAFQVGNTPDVLASFSSRGPGVGHVLKPDIAAPGVNILAQGYAPGATGEARHLGYGQASGTSMAAPHVAGAAAILRQIHPTWSNDAIKSALMTTSRYIGVYRHDGTHAGPLDMGAGRLDLTHAANPGVILDPPSLSFGALMEGEGRTVNVTVTSVAGTTETYTIAGVSISASGFLTPTLGGLPAFSAEPTGFTLGPGESTLVRFTFDSNQGVPSDKQGYLVLESENYAAHMPAWARVLSPPPADVLVIVNDFSDLLGFPGYLDYYTDALDELGLSYDVWSADANFNNPTTIPDAATLASYRAVIYFTGDNFWPDGSFGVSTPLTALDMDRLTEYVNAGGILIAMGQDLSWVLNVSFLYSFILGGNYLQDSVSADDEPIDPILALPAAPAAFAGITLDVSDGGDGAGFHYFIDEIASKPFRAPDNPEELAPYMALMKYDGPDNIDTGIVAMAHRAQPSLETPGISYFGRSIYTTFGLEGVNSDLSSVTRTELLGLFLDWAMDEPQVVIEEISSPTLGSPTTLRALVSSNITPTVGATYRWDFGDGTPVVGPAASDTAAHTYVACRHYLVRVEATDSWGNVALGQALVQPAGCFATGLPLIMR